MHSTPQIETFLPLTEYPRHRVSNNGRVQCSKKKWAHRDDYATEWRDLPPQLGTNGYLYVNMRIGRNRCVSRSIHHLVATAFHGSAMGECVRHLDGKKHNNNADNLAWGTHQDNENDKHAHGTYYSRIASNKVTEAQVIEIRGRAARGELLTIIATDYGMSPITLSRTVNGHIWKHVGGPITNRRQREEARDTKVLFLI